VLEFGVAFGLAGIVVDFIGRDSFNLGYELPKFFFYSIVFGSFMGVRNCFPEIRSIGGQLNVSPTVSGYL